MSGVWDRDLSKVKKYDKLLNNLLLIKSRDQTVFSRVNNTTSFDIAKKFSVNIANKIIKQKQFKIKVNEVDIDELIKIVTKSDDAQEIIDAYDLFNENLYTSKKLLLLKPASFSKTKDIILQDLINKKQKESIRWKQFRRKVLDSNIQDNIWPLHVVTLFISLKCGDKTLYAPLLLKEVEMDIELNIVAETQWKLNEKLIFLLKDEGFEIPLSILDNTNDELVAIVEKITSLLNIKDNIALTDPFINYKTSEITNTFIKFHPGLVLGLFKPAGGYLRKIMKQIIENNEIDSILDTDPEKTIYESNIEESILNNSENLIRIQPSNYSQDEALVSSLIQNTIIWGPPGTGKSQVIANIVANLLYNESTAVVMSQKKAALDVLKKRLKRVAPFVLFILNDNKMIKSEFYKPLQAFVEAVEYSRESNTDNNYQIISDDELKMLEIINNLKTEGTYDVALEIFSKFHNKMNILEMGYKLNPQYKYFTDFADDKDFLSKFIQRNNIQYKSFLGIKRIPGDVKYIADIAPLFLLNVKNEDPNILIKKMHKTNLTDIKQLINCHGIETPKNEIKDNDEYLADLLAHRIIKRVASWKKTNPNNLQKYKKFTSAVRAGRALPFKFMNDHIDIIKDLFPVIVATPETNFINWEKNYFDYAVLDESSQMFIEIGIPILYLAKIKVLAGDQQQMQPTSWFTSREESDIENNEIDVEENANSLLDYAMDKGVYSIMLDQNYRSTAAALMSFSSKAFYDSKLSVIDKRECVESKPIEVINVNGKWEEGVNLIEIEKVIDIYKKIYKRYDSIIILTFNSQQRQLIEKEILEKHPEISKNMEDEKLYIRNIENIQGDEADVVITSVVYDKTTNIHSTYVARPGGKNALNVAISRARSKMIVIKSLSAQEIKSANSEDFKVFKEWLNFLDLKAKEQKSYCNSDLYKLKEGSGHIDSAFESDVLNFLLENVLTKKCTSIEKQYDVGSYKIDLAILDKKKDFVLGIEVDGYKYHAGYRKYLQDKARQEFLESKGYKIYRIKEIDFRINKQEIIDDIENIINS